MFDSLETDIISIEFQDVKDSDTRLKIFHTIWTIWSLFPVREFSEREKISSKVFGMNELLRWNKYSA